MSDYPEHDKLRAISDQSQACYDFLEWLEDLHGARLCHVPPGMHSTYFPLNFSMRKLLADFFDIDQDRLEAERRAMLDELRAAQG
jgi:hypothetical protein